MSCPRFNDGIATYYVIAPSEASANLARYDGVKYGYRAADAASLAEMTSRSRAEGFGDEVQRRILIGTYALSAGYVDAYYKKAQQVRTLIRRDFDRAFGSVDVLLTPTSPTTAFGFGAHAEDPPGQPQRQKACCGIADPDMRHLAFFEDQRVQDHRRGDPPMRDPQQGIPIGKVMRAHQSSISARVTAPVAASSFTSQTRAPSAA